MQRTLLQSSSVRLPVSMLCRWSVPRLGKSRCAAAFFKSDAVSVRSFPTDPANNEHIVPNFNTFGYQGSSRYIELYNIGCSPVNLSSGWQLVLFCEGTTCKKARDSPTSLFPSTCSFSSTRIFISCLGVFQEKLCLRPRLTFRASFHHGPPSSLQLTTSPFLQSSMTKQTSASVSTAPPTAMGEWNGKEEEEEEKAK